MELNFVKLHGLGNDFIMVDDLSAEIELTDSQVAFLCDRHFGIGADGVILVRPSEDPDVLAYMHYINSDGSLAQMCGNGVRCFAKYLVDRGFASMCDGNMVVGTLAGKRPISYTTNDEDCMIDACVDMGTPILAPADVPVALQATAEHEGLGEVVQESLISSPWGDFAFTCVSMGNPHAICFIDDFSILPDELFTSSEKSLQSLRLSDVGAFFESHPAFPEKTNVEFACCTEEGVSMRVFERGCGETLACGTGACATLVAAALTHRSSRTNTVHLLGGSLSIAWNEEDGHVYMTGPATESFSGTIEL